jgi:hypothetical protein
LPGEKFEPVARAVASALTEPVAFSWLCELELSNIYRGAGRNIYSRRVCATILRQIAKDKNAGLLVSCSLDPPSHFRKAIELTKQAIHGYPPLPIAGPPPCC